MTPPELLLLIAERQPVYADSAGSGSTYCTMCTAEKGYPDSYDEMRVDEHDTDCPWRLTVELVDLHRRALEALARQRQALTPDMLGRTRWTRNGRRPPVRVTNRPHFPPLQERARTD